ncbi:MAG: hypothetical protein HYY31_04420 [Chloroflexi bacterium]|nr:hypothetical protein [Chloroflexota bacterium]
MALYDEMKSLVEEITTSHQARVEGLAEIWGAQAQLRKEAHERITEFDKAHQTVARRQQAELEKVRSALARSEAQRSREVASRLQEYREDQAGARAAWQSLATKAPTLTSPTKPSGERAVEKAVSAMRQKGRRPKT